MILIRSFGLRNFHWTNRFTRKILELVKFASSSHIYTLRKIFLDKFLVDLSYTSAWNNVLSILKESCFRIYPYVCIMLRPLNHTAKNSSN